MGVNKQALVVLLGLCVLDAVIPIPMVCFFLIYVVLQKPAWFLDTLHRIYGE